MTDSLNDTLTNFALLPIVLAERDQILIQMNNLCRNLEVRYGLDNCMAKAAVINAMSYALIQFLLNSNDAKQALTAVHNIIGKSVENFGKLNLETMIPAGTA